jgi:sugar phosphate isomerase/epimerase
MIKKVLLTVLMIAASLLTFTGCTGTKVSENSVTSRWPLAVQAYCFREFTLFEAIEKAEQCGFEYIEAYPNQVISKNILDAKGNPQKLWFNASDEVRNKIKTKLRKHNVEMTNFGVCGWIYEDDKGMKMIFDFLKDMGVKTFLVEPHKLEIVPLLDKYAMEYKIKVGFHNHPPRDEKYKYWRPEGVLEALEGTSEYLGASPDVGHWVRSGLDPVEQIKKLEGKIVSVHLKDVSEFGVKKAVDVPLGTGKGKVKEILEELNKQGFTGVFTIEYESNPENPISDIKKCVEYFNKTKAQL